MALDFQCSLRPFVSTVSIVFLACVLSFFVNWYSAEEPVAVVFGEKKEQSPKRRSANRIPEERVWDYIQMRSPEHGQEPRLVYAIAWAESSLNANAENGHARGLMQITERTWKDMTDWPFEMAWDYYSNIEVALDYLEYCESLLRRRDQFSYELLAASYRYGPQEVRRSQYKIENLEVPSNEIYREIFAGNVFPVKIPAKLAIADTNRITE